MSRLMHPATEMRAEPRLPLPAPYTLVRVRLPEHATFCMTGHSYDVSLSGMRFELDDRLPVGQTIEMRVMLPGAKTAQFTATAEVVRIISDRDEVGPVKMAVAFRAFATTLDEYRLKTYLMERGLYSNPIAKAA
ncbi:MAG: PilZ domain-containing protein [Planctomycetota bacterium]